MTKTLETPAYYEGYCHDIESYINRIYAGKFYDKVEEMWRLDKPLPEDNCHVNLREMRTILNAEKDPDKRFAMEAIFALTATYHPITEVRSNAGWHLFEIIQDLHKALKSEEG